LCGLCNESSAEMSEYADEELSVQAERELGETEKKRLGALEAVREWLGENEELTVRFDDDSVLWFLRARKFDVDKTVACMKNFVEFRSSVPEWYSDRDPLKPEIQELLSIGVFLPIPGKDKKGRKIVLIRSCIHDPYKHKQDDVFKVMNMVLDLLCREDESISVKGVVAIIDMKGVSLGHAMQMTPSMIRKAVNSWQDVTPIRTKAMHYVNAPLNVHVVLNIFKRFMKEKLRNRLASHRGNVASIMQDLIQPDHLPVEFGGRGPTIPDIIDDWKDRVVRAAGWFVDEDKHGPFSG